ncbi:MAG: hypothetical protein MZU97_09325 [Bacillus subtilis]|nr:hypothetical protein [Bacillus subtilis]
MKKAKLNNKGIFAMKVLGGGSFVKMFKRAFDYAINNKNIDSIALGMDSMDELIYNSAFFMNTEPDRDLSEKLKSKKRNIIVEPWCVGCAKLRSGMSAKGYYARVWTGKS